MRLGRVQALDGVDVTLAGGRVTMLAGPNGAGKTTLMKVVLGLVRADAASFAVDGAPIAIDRAWKRRVGYLPEAVAFSDNLSGQQVLGFFARARGVAGQRVDAVLEQVGLAHARRRAVRGYSRGMRQRLGLGVAILASPEFLILDEPTAGLDQEGLSVLWAVLDEWRAAGRLVFVSTHDLALTEGRVDEICLLRAGRVLLQGSAERLRREADLPHRVWFELDAAEGRRFEEAVASWGRGGVERDGHQLRVDVAPGHLLELMRIQGEFPEAIRSLRVEEAAFDRVYETLLAAGS